MKIKDTISVIIMRKSSRATFENMYYLNLRKFAWNMHGVRMFIIPVLKDIVNKYQITLAVTLEC
jgi:hypothetical protein